MTPRKNILCSVIATALVSTTITACGGGGGNNVKSNPPPVTIPTPPPPVTPPPPPPVTPPPTVYAPSSAHTQMNVQPAYDRGLTGKDVVVGVYDSGVNPELTQIKDKYLGKIEDGKPSNIGGNIANHGGGMATMILGSPYGRNLNGIAPDAKFWWFDRGSAANYMTAIEKGVKIINASLGSGDDSGETNRQDQGNSLRWSGLADAFTALKNAGVLYVHAAGNQSKPNPSTMSATPYFLPELNLDNWLTVVGVDQNGKIGSYSNQCGLAKDFCVSATGYVDNQTSADGNYTTGGWQGTSVATAATTGVAALVKQAFPWMTGSQIAQTLKTTATDLGVTGVDEVYGWGLINADKATKGVAQVQSIFSAAVPTGTTSVFSNAISGDGSIEKTGGGTLILAGNGTYTGGTLVNEGILGIQSSLSSNVTQNGGRIIASGGRIDADLSQNGGSLTVDPMTGLTVSGNANLTHVNIGGSGSYVGNQWNGTLLTAGSLNGEISTDRNYLLYGQSVTRDGNTVTGNLTRVSATATQTGDQSSLQGARGLDAAFSLADRNGTQAQKDLLTPLQFMEASSTATLDSLAGQAHATARGMAMEGMNIQHRWLGQRAIESARSENGGAWAMAGSFESRIKPGNAFNADVRSNLLAAGADIRVGENFTVGVAGMKGDTRSDFNRFGGEVKNRQRGGGVYATYAALDGKVVTTGRITQSKLTNDVERLVIAGNPQSLNVSSRTGATATSAALGVDVKATDRVTLGAEVQHDRLKSDAFREAGTTGFELVADASTARRTLAGLTIRLNDGREALADGWHWDAGLGWYREIGSNLDTGFTAQYAALNGASFKVEGMDVPKDQFWANFGTAWKNGKNVVFLRGDVRHDRNGTAPGLSLGYRREF